MKLPMRRIQLLLRLQRQKDAWRGMRQERLTWRILLEFAESPSASSIELVDY
jgi:hypothetical protein